MLLLIIQHAFFFFFKIKKTFEIVFVVQLVNQLNDRFSYVVLQLTILHKMLLINPIELDNAQIFYEDPYDGINLIIAE